MSYIQPDTEYVVIQINILTRPPTDRAIHTIRRLFETDHDGKYPLYICGWILIVMAVASWIPIIQLLIWLVSWLMQ
jgi:hypothetical protein